MISKKCVPFVLLISSFGVVLGQIPNLGFCPDYLPMSEFDMSRFLGKWYEAERYFTFSEVASRCVVTDYAKANSGRIYVSNEVTNRLTGVKRIINGNLQLVGKGDEGKMHVKYATTPIPTENTFMVLDTDYDNFAVVWSCAGFGPVHAQNAWLMTRDRLPSGVILQKAYGVLDKFKISRTFFVKTDQEGCAIAASDINAANGITATSTIPEATGADQRNVNEVRLANPELIEKEIDELNKPSAEKVQESSNVDVAPDNRVEAIIVEDPKSEENKKPGCTKDESKDDVKGNEVVVIKEEIKVEEPVKEEVKVEEEEEKPESNDLKKPDTVAEVILKRSDADVKPEVEVVPE